MPPSPRIHHQSINVDVGFLPAPATKLIITQYLEVNTDVPWWAWIIVAAFFDRNDTIIWSTREFLGHLNVELESDDEEPEELLSSQGDETPLDSQPGMCRLLLLAIV